MRSRLFSVALGIALASCCPTIWMVVTSRDRGPLPPVAEVHVIDAPLPIPPNLENRFDLFDPPLDPSSPAWLFNDIRNPRVTINDWIARLAVARRSLLELGTGGVPFNPLVKPTKKQDAVLKCGPFNCTLTVGNIDECRPAALIHLPPVGGEERTVLTGVRTCENADTLVVLSEGKIIQGSTDVTVQFAFDVKPSKSLLSFVHLSDAQIRDPSIRLGDPELSARMDRIIDSFEHDEDQELFGPFILQALVATVNADVDSRAKDDLDSPKFVIHTGDSIDAGTVRELEIFHTLMDELAIPWFNVLGNHDALVFGNLLPAKSETDETSCVSLASISSPYGVSSPLLVPEKLCIEPRIKRPTDDGSTDDVFVAGMNHLESRTSFIEGHKHESFAATPYLPTVRFAECKKDLVFRPSSRFHGFDFYAYGPNKTPDRGYYAFAYKLPTVDTERHAVVIALNTEDLEDGKGGTMGRLGTDQREWFEKVLACVGPHDLVLVFAHHAPSVVELDDGTRLRDSTLLESKNIVGYFYGHYHRHGLCRDDRACSDFWEIETGSLIEFPHEGRLVRIKTVGAGLGFIETTIFRERLAHSNQEIFSHVLRARRGGMRDHCGKPEIRCSPDGVPRRDDGRHTHARLFFRLPGGG